jgi:hypothetical protein
MKKYAFVIALIACNFSLAADRPKYKQGDCITATDVSYTWYGKFVRVEAFSKIDGYDKPVYILVFPRSVVNSVIFSREIEAHTKLVKKEKCEP